MAVAAVVATAVAERAALVRPLSGLENKEWFLNLQFLSVSQDNDFYHWTKSLSNAKLFKFRLSTLVHLVSQREFWVHILILEKWLFRCAGSRLILDMLLFERPTEKEVLFRRTYLIIFHFPTTDSVLSIWDISEF